jgi:hypothetical protein
MNVAHDMVELTTRMRCIHKIGQSRQNAATQTRAKMDRASDVIGQSAADLCKNTFNAYLPWGRKTLKMCDV